MQLAAEVFFDDLLYEAYLVVLVEDGEVRFQTDKFGMTAQDAERALEILAQPCTLPLPPPRRASEAEEPPSIDAFLVDGVAGIALERDPSGTRSEGREGYSGF